MLWYDIFIMSDVVGGVFFAFYGFLEMHSFMHILNLVSIWKSTDWYMICLQYLYINRLSNEWISEMDQLYLYNRYLVT